MFSLLVIITQLANMDLVDHLNQPLDVIKLVLPNLAELIQMINGLLALSTVFLLMFRKFKLK